MKHRLILAQPLSEARASAASCWEQQNPSALFLSDFSLCWKLLANAARTCCFREDLCLSLGANLSFPCSLLPWEGEARGLEGLVESHWRGFETVEPTRLVLGDQ